MDIRQSEVMSSRPCSYCLAFQDDSVFADFELDESGCLYLLRISFDGFGCCEPKANIGKIDSINSKYIVNAIANDSLTLLKVHEILRGYFRVNQNSLWQDALLEHELI